MKGRSFFRLLVSAPLAVAVLWPCWGSTEPTRRYLGVRAASIMIFDSGTISTPSDSRDIDTQRGTCESGSATPTAEPFYDTIIGLDLRNDTALEVRVTRIRFRLGAGNNDAPARSKRLRALSASVVTAHTTARILFPAFVARNGEKFVDPRPAPISGGSDFRKLRVVVRGRDQSGRRFRIRLRTELSLGNFDRC